MALVEFIPTRYTFRPKGLATQEVIIEARDRENKLWAVCINDGVLNTDGQIEEERMPSSRTPAFLRRTRFTLDEAKRRATDYIHATAGKR